MQNTRVREEGAWSHPVPSANCGRGEDYEVNVRLARSVGEKNSL